MSYDESNFTIQKGYKNPFHKLCHIIIRISEPNIRVTTYSKVKLQIVKYMQFERL